MKALRGLRALVRVELRSVLQNPARSALVVTLIALPVAALVAGSIVVRVIELSPAAMPEHASIAPAIFLLGTLGFVEAALVAAAAFAVGVRRRQREVGLLAAGGATGRGVVAAHVVAASVQAVVAGGLGAGAGIGVAALLYLQIGTWTGRLPGAFEVPLPQLLGAVALGVGTAVLSAWLPARVAVRLPIRVALSARRPAPPPTRPWSVTAGALIVVGLGLVLVAPHVAGTGGVLASIVGAASGVLGFGACSPWLLEQCSRRAARLPLAWRLAVRDIGRHRARSAPVVTAIAAGTAVSIAAASVLASIGVAEADTVGPRLVSSVVLLLSLLVGLSVIAAATALAAAESHADRLTLMAVGATARLVRAHAAARAASLALLGCMLAVPAGLLPALGVTAAVDDLSFLVPWREIVALSLGLPTLAYLGAFAFTQPVVATCRARA